MLEGQGVPGRVDCTVNDAVIRKRRIEEDIDEEAN